MFSNRVFKSCKLHVKVNECHEGNIVKIFKRVSEGAEDECLSTKHAAIGHLNSFSYETMSTKTRFEEEAKHDSEMAYCFGSIPKHYKT